MTVLTSAIEVLYFGSTPVSNAYSYIEGAQLPQSIYQLPQSLYTIGRSFQIEPVQIEPVVLTFGDMQSPNVQIVPLNTVVMGNSFVCYPANSSPQLASDYGELGETLAELRDSSADDEWLIDEPVYDIATQVASSLMALSYPAPKIFSHGRKSVVFNWEAADDRSLYLTISKDYVAGLLSSPSKIERRVQVPVALLVDTSLVRPFVEWTKSGQPVVSIGNLLETTAV